MIHRIVSTGSTNADLAEMARAGAPEGTWLRADVQTGGRGRMGRNWSSPEGNLYASGLVRLQPGDPPAPTLALLTAVVLVDTLDALAPGLRRMIKWPNDVLVAGAKLSGILLERAGEAVIVGVGVNLAVAPDIPDRPATCLAGHGYAIGPDAFCEALAERFGHWLGRWRSDGLEQITRAWRQAGPEMGAAMRISEANSTQTEGVFAGLNADGSLSLRLADGTIRAIHAGDVFFI